MLKHKAKFEIYKDAAGEFRFRLRAPNGEIIAVSEAYVTLEGCKNGIVAIKEYAPKAIIFDLTIARFEKVRELMTTLKPEKLKVKTGSIVKLDEDLIATKTPDGKIVLWEVVK